MTRLCKQLLGGFRVAALLYGTAPSTDRMQRCILGHGVGLAAVTAFLTLFWRALETADRQPLAYNPCLALQVQHTLEGLPWQRSPRSLAYASHHLHVDGVIEAEFTLSCLPIRGPSKAFAEQRHESYITARFSREEFV